MYSADVGLSIAETYQQSHRLCTVHSLREPRVYFGVLHKRSKNRLHYDILSASVVFGNTQEYALVETDNETFQSEVLAFYRIDKLDEKSRCLQQLRGNSGAEGINYYKRN